MIDSRTWSGKVQDKSRVTYFARKQRNAQRMILTCQDDTETFLKGLPFAKYEAN